MFASIQSTHLTRIILEICKFEIVPKLQLFFKSFKMEYLMLFFVYSKIEKKENFFRFHTSVPISIFFYKCFLYFRSNIRDHCCIGVIDMWRKYQKKRRKPEKMLYCLCLWKINSRKCVYACFLPFRFEQQEKSVDKIKEMYKKKRKRSLSKEKKTIEMEKMYKEKSTKYTKNLVKYFSEIFYTSTFWVDV